MADESTSPTSANPVKISTDASSAQWQAQMDDLFAPLRSDTTEIGPEGGPR